MKPFSTSHSNAAQEGNLSIRALLFTRGFGGALNYLCTISAFSVLSLA